MIMRSLDGAGDWRFGQGLGSYARDEQAIEENIRTRLMSWVGDCFFAKQEGIDWRSRLSVGQEDDLKEELKVAILQSYGVVGVTDIQVTKDAMRRYTFTYVINTIFGQSFTGLISQA